MSQRLSGNERIELGVSGIDPKTAISAIRKIKNIIDVRSDTRAEKLDQASKENYHSILVDTKSNNNSSEKIAKLIVDNGWGLRNLTPLPMTLEEIFLQLTQDK